MNLARRLSIHLIAAGAGGIPSSALATDLPVKAKAAPVYTAALSSWTGCYLGAQIGVAQSRSHWDYTNNNPYSATGNAGPQLVLGADFSQKRGVIGGQAGCNYALSGPWMIGLEGGFLTNPLNRTQDNHNNLTGPAGGLTLMEAVTTNVKSIASVTGRLGLAVAPNWLLYGKGGFAAGQIETFGATSPAVPGFGWNDVRWHPGWTGGGGFEYRLFRNVTIGAEYNYYKFGASDHVGPVGVTDNGPPPAPANPVAHRVNADVQTAMARINFYQDMSPLAQSAPERSPFAGAFSAFANTAVTYTSWTGDRGANVFAPDRGSGHQVYSPTTIGINYDQPSAIKVETRIKSGYVYAHQSTPGQIATYEGPVDTQASFNAVFLNFDSVRPQMGVALNLPTGTAYLPNNQRFARMDPDLVEIGSYGAGFNVNPTAGLVIGINQNTAISFSAGYAWQGAFVREAVDLSAGGGFGAFNIMRRINPGDVFTGNANITTQIGNVVLLGSFAYMSETEVKTDGMPSGRAGARYTSNLAANTQFDERWALALNGSWSFQEKNEIPMPPGGLVTEPKNSNSHLLIGSIEPSYQITEQLRLAANYSILWRSENFYDQFENQFIPAKIKHSVGASANYAFSPTAIVALRGSYAWIEQETGALLPLTVAPAPGAPTFGNLPPRLKYESWMASISANFRY